MTSPVRVGSAGDVVVLGASDMGAIRMHAEATYPNECCGALLGATTDRTTRVVETLPLPNTTHEGPRRRFLVDAADYRAADARARAAGTEIVGFYHSHPDHAARPSAYDLDHAWPNLSYVIVSVTQGRAADARSWRLRDDRSGFFEESIQIHETTRTDDGNQSFDSDSTAAVYGQAGRDRH